MKLFTSALAVIGISLAAALIIRYAVIEPSRVGLQCVTAIRPWWCLPRQALVFVHIGNGWSLLGLAGLALAAWRRRTLPLLAALAFSCLGMILYNTGLSALVFLVGLLLLGQGRYFRAQGTS
ncbi:MAG TPA: hypothetical protein VHL08_03920 [Dongiaceae bacterium]|jgi:hypothetical protein|nr:hypothetical protein [Dongiaceae bacterium]